MRYQGAALEELESTMSVCQKTEAVAKGASQRASESLRAVKQRVKSLQSQCVELDEQLFPKDKAAKVAAGVEYQAALTQSVEAKAKFEAAQKCLQAVKSGLSSSENGVAANLAEQARVADGEKCSAHTELSQLKMRQKHLQSDLAKQESIVLKTFGHGSMDGESKKEVKQKELIVHIEELTETLTRAEADDKAVGSESVLSGQVEESLRNAEQRLVQASLKAKLAHDKATNAVAERKKEQEDAEKALAEAKNQVEITVAALREKNSLKESLRLETEEHAKELNTLKLSLEEAIQSVEAAEVEEKHRIEASQLAKEALIKAREAVTHQRGLIDETVRLLATTEKQVIQLVQSLNQTNSLIDKLSHQIKMQTKESAEANSKIERLLEVHPWIHEEKQHFGVENGAYCFTSRDPIETRRRIQSLKERCNRLSQSVNMRAMNMLGSAEKQYSELIRRQEIVLADKRKIQTVIDDLDKRKEEVLLSAYNKVNEEFYNIFATLLPGSKARLSPPDGRTVLDGLEIKVAFGDVWKESLSEISGGQWYEFIKLTDYVFKSLSALSLVLALLLFKPAPLYILDEVNAALDLSHTQNIGQLIKNHFKHSQFIVESLKDGMFNNANVLFKTKFVGGVSTVSRHVPLGVRNENKQPQTDRHRKRVK
ncbi:hypothetical protein MN116_001296 [Schistosoma mekongi]|uniref:RecF/RecN/SMC N-terminal domain-containing protein n=1 Tax=Schistosoma mekongi TaxID=38744 RepID=A0AAE1ZLG7_SCHME|nr:hypothetical protein MN116_001296 [Schistosoma mekongi]